MKHIHLIALLITVMTDNDKSVLFKSKCKNLNTWQNIEKYTLINCIRKLNIILTFHKFQRPSNYWSWEYTHSTFHGTNFNYHVIRLLDRAISGENTIPPFSKSGNQFTWTAWEICKELEERLKWKFNLHSVQHLAKLTARTWILISI